MKKSKKNKATKKTTGQGKNKVHISDAELDKMIFSSTEWEMANKDAITNILKKEYKKAGLVIDNNLIDQHVKAYTEGLILNPGFQKKISKINSLMDEQKKIEKHYRKMSKYVFEEFGVKVDDGFLKNPKKKP
jgi:two-component SAPR family response regulator